MIQEDKLTIKHLQISLNKEKSEREAEKVSLEERVEEIEQRHIQTWGWVCRVEDPPSLRAGGWGGKL
jgi:hypothetical protein